MRIFLLLGSVNAGLAVILGAFGAHGLKAILEPSALSVFQTGTQYHFYHSLALLLVGILVFHFPGRRLIWAGYLFALGIVLFCGSLYGLSIFKWRVLGPVTPVGGLLFILGWGLMALNFVGRLPGKSV